MRIARKLVLAGLLGSTLTLAGCYNDRPGYWGDHRGRHHHHHHDRDRDHDGHHDRGDRGWG